MSWTDEYREIVEFYYWEPQHIGRAQGVKRFAGAEAMWQHVHGLEVSLNHILNLFFSLYSGTALQQGLGWPETVTFVSSAQLAEWQRAMREFTQPDMYFAGTTDNLAIELKLGAKISIAQIAKYCIFNAHVSPGTTLRLIILSPHKELASVSKEQFTTVDDLLQALRAHTPKTTLTTPENYAAAVTGLTIDVLSIADFAAAFRAQPTANVTEQKLVSGLLDYLQSRQLLPV